MRTSIAAGVFEMNAAFHAAADVLSGDGVAGLVRPARDAQSLAAKSQHFRHEDQALELPAFVESPKDLLFSEHLDQLTASEVQGVTGVDTWLAQPQLLYLMHTSPCASSLQLIMP